MITLRLQREKVHLAAGRGFPSLFAQTQTNLFKSTAFEASDDDFQDTPLFRKAECYNRQEYACYLALQMLLSMKRHTPAVSYTLSVEAVLPAPIPSTGCTSDSITTTKKY
ncbi:uncharacterized protein RHIMIDRAFT_312987 [Rhizopus microsporus ATCC 52813]|uniref:Uncharacterized protein n=1 Tax=Rhizopus microsporus ATCC 52813 TaxID=1340429 RepID=A0A2G4SW29_RHIZD|nr:uncharacterized protein RHIMIDRAFT_312987 [Rhizopus microsporus ATCC 52813]PHZ12955.1 hypothetical protein RHIMIDRAFT_312987 [Rhizopus microsporus ATCC 52813]